MDMETAALAETELGVRYVLFEDAPQDLTSLLLLRVTDEERARAKKLQRTQDQQAFLAGRVLVRKMLSERAAEPIAGWQFEQKRSGKPVLVRSPGTPDLRFNISHTADLLFAAVAVGREIGVDIERLNDRIDCLEIAREHFAESEIEFLRSAPVTRQRELFFSLWTIKEAYLKARGEGLSVALPSFAVSLEPLMISRTELPDREDDQWFFWRDQPMPSHLAALAAQQRPGEKLICRSMHLNITELLI